MKPANWKDTAELVGIAAILVGLYFVYSEIQQNSLIARADLNMIIYQDALSINQKLSEPDFAETYLKALKVPQELTPEERLQVNAMLTTVANIFRRERQLYNMGIFLEYENMPRVLSRRFFMSEYGRAFWAIERKTMPEAIRNVVDTVLAESSEGDGYVGFDAELVDHLRSN